MMLLTMYPQVINRRHSQNIIFVSSSLATSTEAVDRGVINSSHPGRAFVDVVMLSIMLIGEQ